MTPEQARTLAATARDRLAKISQDEPWTQPGYGDYGWYVSGPAGTPEFSDSDQGKIDAQFVADAPAFIAALAEAVETLTADGLSRAQIEHLLDTYTDEGVGIVLRRWRTDPERAGAVFTGMSGMSGG